MLATLETKLEVLGKVWHLFGRLLDAFGTSPGCSWKGLGHWLFLASCLGWFLTSEIISHKVWEGLGASFESPKKMVVTYSCKLGRDKWGAICDRCDIDSVWGAHAISREAVSVRWRILHFQMAVCSPNLALFGSIFGHNQNHSRFTCVSGTKYNT